MDVHVIIPLKDASLGKARLAGALSASQRRALISAMLARVVAAVQAAQGVSKVSVLTSASRPVPTGCARLSDLGLSLNDAVARAACVLRARGETGAVLVVHADLPFVGARDIEALVARCRPDAVVAAPDWTATGTNALAYPLRCPVTPHYGRGSFAAHGAQAAAAGLAFEVVRRPGLAEDIDEPAQLAGLVARGGTAFGFLADAGRSVIKTTAWD